MAKASKQTPEKLEELAATLTEEQLLAMPEEDYMNDLQLAFFKHRLKALEKEILDNANQTTDNLRAVSYTHLTLPTILRSCRSRWSPYH